MIDGGGSPGSRAFVDLHVHTSASFDSLAAPESQVKAAATRGLTHIAITDHDTIDGALAARDYVAREGLDIGDRKSTRLNSSHFVPSRMPSSA